MKHKKSIILGIPILILAVIAVIIINGANNMRPENALNNFSTLIEQGKINNINLTIYYLNPLILTYAPLSVEHLISDDGVQKFVINGDILEEHIDLLKKLGNCALIPPEKETRLNARIYYVFKNKNRKLFDVVMWSVVDYNVFVNGIEFKWNDIFYDAVKPFIPEHKVNDDTVSTNPTT